MLCLILCVFALLAGAWLALVALRKPWIVPVPGVRLAPARVLEPREAMAPDSGFLLLSNAVHSCGVVYPLPEVMMRAARTPPWSENAPTNLVALLEDAEPSLELGRRAARAPESQMPALPGDYARRISYVAFRKLVWCFELSALRKAAGGDYAGSYDELRAMLGCAAILTRGGFRIDYMIGAAAVRRACATARRVAAWDAGAGAHSRRMSEFLRDYEAGLEPWAEAVRQEGVFAVRRVDTVFADGPPHYFDRRAARLLALGRLLGSTPAGARRSCEAVCSHLIDAAQKPYDQAWYDRFDATLECGILDMLVSQDPVGRLLAGMSMSSLSSGHRHWLAHRVDLRATALLLAIRLYEAQEGRLPASLQELVPEYIEAVPTDPFKESDPLRYDVATNGVWRTRSVGANGVDDGGIGRDDGNGPDVVITSEPATE